MKKVLALLVVMAFVVSVAAPTFAAPVAKKKAVKAKKVVVTKKKVVTPKAPVAVPPPPPAPPVVIPPPPPPVKAAPPAPTGLFGMGLQTAAEVGMVAGMVGLSGNVLLADPMGIGGMLGLSNSAVNWKIGLGYFQGNDVSSKTWKAVPLTIGGVINLPAEMMGGVESFIGGGINYVAYRSGQTAGSIGGDIYVGCQGNLGLGGKTYGELGYSILRTGSSDKGAYSSKSLTVLIGQKILL